MRILPLPTLTATAALAASGALAQAVPLQEVVVSADRTPTPASETGASVSVLAERDFALDGRPFALDFVTGLPGVTVQQNGPPGTTSGFAVRGAPQRYVRVLVDGIEISDPTAPQVAPSLSGLLVDDVGRIEVLKGSQSALYGGQAVGGVIDIASPRAEADGLQSRYLVEGGSFDTLRGRYTLAGRDARGDFALTLLRFRTDGFSAAEKADGNTEDDGYDTTRLSFAGTLYATERASVFASAFYQDESGDFDAFPGPGGDAANTFDSETWGARAGVDVTGPDGRLDNRLALSWFSVDRDSDEVGGRSTFRGSRLRAEYLGQYRPSDALRHQFGAEYSREESDVSTPFGSPEGEQWITGVWGQTAWQPADPLTLTLALRYDHHSEFDGYPTGRATAAYAVTPETLLRASVGTGFRPPSNFELFDPQLGNPGLEPETSLGADVSVERSLAGGRGRVTAALFYLEIDDLIGFDPVTFAAIQTDGTADSRGLELAGAWDLADALTLSGAYTYTDARDAEDARRLRIPRHDVNVALDGALTERLTLGLGARYAADLPDEPFAESVAFEEDYVVVNARLGYAVSDAAELYLRAENLLDAEYQTAEGFSTADQSFFVGVTGRF